MDEIESGHVLPVRAVPLGGRRQLCINAKVRDIGRTRGDDRMNEACLDLQKSGKYYKQGPHDRPALSDTCPVLVCDARQQNRKVSVSATERKRRQDA